MNFFQRTPFFLLLLAFSAGVLLYQYYVLTPTVGVVILFLGLLPSLISFLDKKSERRYRNRWLFGVTAFAILMLMGYSVSHLFEKRNRFSALNDRAVYEMELLDVPLEKEKSYRSKVKLLHRFDSTGISPAKGEAYIYFQKDSIIPSLLIGDKVIAEAEFKSPDGVQNPYGFDYALYLKRQGIHATAYVDSLSWELSQNEAKKSLLRYADKSRRYLLHVFREYGIEGDEFAVLAALTLGYKDELQPDLKTIYSASGAAHILAVSGLHVGVVYAVIFFLLGFLKKTKRQRTARALIATLFIWGYAFITGLSPAVMRASLMLSFVSLATMLDRKPQIFNTILMSAFLMLLFNPNLLFNVSFQLSYAAVLSIVTIQAPLFRLYTPQNRIVKWLWALLAVSVAAQVGTAPISIYYFNQFPNYFLLTNVIAIPLSTLIIYLALLLLAISFAAVPAKIVAAMLNWSVSALNYLLAKIIDLPGSLSVINISTLQLWLLIVFVLAAAFFLIQKRKPAFILALFALLAFSLVRLNREYQSHVKTGFVVFADSRVSAVNFINGKSNRLYSPESEKAEVVCEAFWRNMLLDKVQNVEADDSFEEGFYYFNNRSFLILSGEFLRNVETDSTIEVDYLIMTDRYKPRMEELLQMLQPKMVIVDKSITPWYTNHVKEVCEEAKIDCYLVAENGAYVEYFEN